MLRAYWWEGYFGFGNVVRRVLNGKSPYIYNFGDYLSPFILSKLSGQPIKHSSRCGKLLALGSVFFALRDKDHVWGSGLLEASHGIFASQCQDVVYHAVRGPETRNELRKRGIDCPEIYGDPGLLLPLLVKNDVEQIHSVGVVPHFTHFDFYKSELRGTNALVIDVEMPFTEVVRAILSCKVILSTSLHGVVVAEAYGIPALFIRPEEPSWNELFKFKDYFHSTNRELKCSLLRERSALGECIEKAFKQSGPRIDLQPLVSAAPFSTENLSFKKSGWTELSNLQFKSSILPPRLALKT